MFITYSNAPKYVKTTKNYYTT